MLDLELTHFPIAQKILSLITDKAQSYTGTKNKRQRSPSTGSRFKRSMNMIMAWAKAWASRRAPGLECLLTLQVGSFQPSSADNEMVSIIL